jgi:hypothetical protein
MIVCIITIVRYTLLIFVQPQDFVSKAKSLVTASTPLTGFDLKSFMKATGLGDPIGGTFWFTGPQNSTDTTSTTICSSNSTAATTTSDLQQSFNDAQIVPDVTSTFDPAAVLGVAFPGVNDSSQLTHVVVPGINLTVARSCYFSSFPPWTDYVAFRGSAGALFLPSSFEVRLV